jgi:hypothetical protein
MIRRFALISGVSLVLALGTSAGAQTFLKDPIPQPIPVSPIQVQLTPLATGLVAPIWLTVSGDGGHTKYVIDQRGLILVLTRNGIRPTPFLDITGVISQLTPAFRGAPQGLNPGYDERGLLGLAFHPGFSDGDSPGFRKVYTLHNVPVTKKADFPEPPFPNANVVPNCQEVIAEWKVVGGNGNGGGDGNGNGRNAHDEGGGGGGNAGVIDPTSYREVLRFDRPEFNHNGGTIAFGPDGLLYAAFGDGGAANDAGAGHNPITGNAQDLTTILGKMIRIDPTDPRSTRDRDGILSANGQYRIPQGNPFVGTAGAVKEIYAYGFRNPFRFSFDHGGRLVLADVGQNNIEEVDIVTRGGNFGWHLKEGTFLFDPATGNVFVGPDPKPGLIDPVVEYDHTEADPDFLPRLAIIGGYVYHGSRVPELRGKYICADLNGVLLVADLEAKVLQQLIPKVGMFVKGIGQDAEGELYVLGSTIEGPSGTNGVIAQIRSAFDRGGDRD